MSAIDKATVVELMRTGFGAKPNLSARGKLSKLIGPERALACGRLCNPDLASLTDMQPGKLPSAEIDIEAALEAANSENAIAAQKASERPKKEYKGLATSESNPWSRAPRNVRLNDKGEIVYSPDALRRQQSLVAMNPAVAAQVATAAGSYISAKGPPSNSK
jgi:hypothetical protein